MNADEKTKGTILVVEDLADNLRLMVNLLTRHGYQVRPAPSGRHALSTIQKKLPDLILLDVVMPEMDGFELCHILKSDEKTENIPVVFLSASDDLEDKMKGFELGGVDYITKPFHEKEVLVRVETHLRIHTLNLKLQAEKARFKSLAEAAFEAILIHKNNTIQNVNPEAVRLFGYKESELIGSDLLSFISSGKKEIALSDKRLPFETEIIAKGNLRKPVEIRTSNLTSDDHEMRVTAIRDLSSQKQIELEKLSLLQENTALKLNMKDRYKFGDIIGRSPAMQMVYELITKASSSAYPVVIFGESGTGKELVAKTIHTLSDRAKGPFVAVNCGAVTESLFEREFFGHRKGAFTDAVKDEPGYLDAANNGILFLDEIGELPLPMQVKLLRVFESGEYTPVGDVDSKKSDLRIIAATNKNLSDLVRKGVFREDFFYRIHVIEIIIPPLRARHEDIRLLVEHILSKHNAQEKLATLPEKLSQMLYHYDWPGNVRELINTIQRYLATDYITLPGHPHTEPAKDSEVSGGLSAAIESLERRMIENALRQTNWHRVKTAELLQIPRRTLYRKMQKYDLDEPQPSETL